MINALRAISAIVFGVLLVASVSGQQATAPPNLRVVTPATQIIHEGRRGATGPYWLLPMKPTDVDPPREDICALVRARKPDDGLKADVIIITVMEYCSLFTK